MILPNKYISISESLIGLSACILDVISNKKYTVEEVWEKINRYYIDNKKIKNKPNYSKYILTLTYMYMSQMINYDEKGMIFNENITTRNIE